MSQNHLLLARAESYLPTQQNTGVAGCLVLVFLERPRVTIRIRNNLSGSVVRPIEIEESVHGKGSLLAGLAV